MNFAPGAATRKLTLTGGDIYAGNVVAQFQPSEPFKFIPATVK